MEYGAIQLDEEGRPVDRSYFEGSLPDDLREIIRRFLSAHDDFQREWHPTISTAESTPLCPRERSATSARGICANGICGRSNRSKKDVRFY